MNYSVFDMEGDGLYPSKIYCVSVNEVIDGKSKSYTMTDYDEMRSFFLNQNTLVGHNIIMWDIPHIERLLGIKIRSRLVDSLGLSWYLYPLRPKHGLDPWGEELGISKPKIDDWYNQTLEEYIHRCEEDVKINTKLFQKQLKYLNKIYSLNPSLINGIISYLGFKLICAREQEQVRWKLDTPTCRKNLYTLEIERDKKYNKLVEVMPQNIKYKKVTKPKKPFKKDGTHSAVGQRWFALVFSKGLPETFEGEIKVETAREEGNPSSHVQLKNWLFSLGWKPITFKYDRNKQTGDVRKIPQVSLPNSGGICRSVKELYQVEADLVNLEGLYILEHRIGILKGFLKNVDDEGYLQARIHGFTNTLRFKHTVIVNLPGVSKPHGKEVRECLIAPDNHVLCGSDMSSLEDRTKQHYMYKYDPKYVREMTKPGFDPHLDLALFDGAMSQEDLDFYKSFDYEKATSEEKLRYANLKAQRHEYKTTNYAATYGSGAKTLSRSSKMPLKRANKLLIAYWKKNWAVKKVAAHCKVIKVDGQMWQYNPVSGFWYSLRYEKDRFSTLNQGTGVYCFDSWVKECRNRGVKMCGQFHDEVVSPTLKTNAAIQEKESILKEAIIAVNNRLKLNRNMDIDVQFGKNYSEIH